MRSKILSQGRFYIMSALALAILISLRTPAVMAADPSQGSPNMEEMMKKWEAMATPGEHHKLLDQFVGTWDVTSRMWMEGPDKPPMESKGTSKVTWILGGRFIQEEASGEMMGKPFAGLGLTGYDNFKNRYVSFWVDNSGTGLYTSEGGYNPQEKTFTYFGKMDDPSTGERDKTVMFVIRAADPNKHIFEMHDLEIGGKSTKVGEMIYTRN